jgi:hypothetical protein
MLLRKFELEIRNMQIVAINSDSGQLTERRDYSPLVVEIVVLILIIVIAALLIFRKENSN